MTKRKRIGIVMADQHYIPHGGLGQFTKGISEMFQEQNHIVDIITDTKPKDPFFTPNGKIHYPSKPVSLAGHRTCFSFKDSYRFETCINIRDAIMKAYTSNMYDMLILQSPEMLMACSDLGIHLKIPCVFYTHLENVIYDDIITPTFTDQYLDITRCLLRQQDLITATQTSFNVECLKQLNIKAVEAHMPIPEKDLLEPSNQDKKGILFIGRWEERKNPEAFLDALSKLKDKNIKVKVMTAKQHVEKATKDLLKIGFNNLDIRGGIIGKEKVDFIKSSKICVNTSKRESFCFALFEALGHCHCIVLEKYNWWEHFGRSNLNLGKNNNHIAELIEDLLDKDVPETQIDYVRSYDQSAKDQWNDILNTKLSKNRDFKSSGFYKTLEQKGGMFWDEFMDEVVKNRSDIPVSVDDVVTAYNSWDLIESDNDTKTWLTLKSKPLPMPIIEEEVDIFEF